MGALNAFFVARGEGEAMQLVPLMSLDNPPLRAGEALKAPSAFAALVPAALARDDKPR